MGKFRAHQAKSRRKREKAQQRTRGNDVAVTVGDSNGHMKRGEPREPQVDEGNMVAGAAGAGAGAGAIAGKACASKKSPKILTYSKEHSVLICGDGDFSFTRGIIRHRGTGLGVVATSLDSRETVLKKYPRAKSWLPQLDEDGAQIAHCVDATRLHETLLDTSATEDNGAEAGTAAKHVMLFDRVVFNFPHTGKQRTHLNRNLIRDFFASTRDLVKCAADGGEVHVALKNKRPYSDWNIRAMAKESGLVLVRSLAFDPSVFPGYGHSTTDPKAKEFDAVGAKTHVFCRARGAVDDNVDASGGFPTIVKSNSVGGGGALQVTRKGEVQGMGNGGEEDDADEDDWDMRGKAEEDLEDSTSTIDGNSLSTQNGIDTVMIAGKGNEHHHGKSKSSSGTLRGKDKSKSKRKERAGTSINSSVDSDSKQEQRASGDLSDSTAAHGNEGPHVFQKKKAAKRRAQRKRAAAIKKAATVADGVEEDASAAPSDEGGSLPKRKRGKYVRPGKKHD